MSEPLSISASDIDVSAFYPQNVQDSLQEASDHASQGDLFTWPNINLGNGPEALRSSWAGEVEKLDSLPNLNVDAISNTEMQIISELSCTEMETLFNNAADLWETALYSPDGSTKISKQTDGHFQFRSISLPSDSPENKPPLRIFGKIMQPPTAMLMGGIKKWRHLQQYLRNLASHNDTVMNALLGLDRLLEWDNISGSTAPKRQLQDHIHSSFNITTRTIQEDISLSPCDINSNMDDWLAAIFLLAWIQVLRDRVEHDSESPFPTELTNTIITCSYDWNWYSRQLLSWFNSLDSKSSHLSGPTLLSPKALQVMSQYPIQIISCDYKESKYRRDSLDDDKDFQALSQSPLSEVSEHGDSGIVVPAKSPCDVKEIVLRALLQPAAKWYLKTQAYCRRISALDKHHQERFTPDAEIRVALEGKQIHRKLWDLWAQCPFIISLSTAELSTSIAPDVATRVQEISNIYLASFWILFIYLHRICWWHLPHTKAVTGALEKTWEHIKNSYGEADDVSQEMTVHPALMWPVFLFGAECKNAEQRIWAIEQLKALGKTRPVLKSQNQNLETLPAFRISHGATRNAKQASLLLEALTQKQKEMKCRVNDRDLAMDMFNCYFSIV
ncbi:Ff.00g114530.m01.CDS01 [Fusarium sp. VM40]|nr:Ff.00g114530.m01.CDS01 [Fusarium sp. VM40]